MTEGEHFSTLLAYTKSPKISKRSSFQEELEAALSARASRTKTAENHTYSDDFDEDFDDDEILKELLNTRKKKIQSFKAGKMKAKMNDFQLSDEDDIFKPKKVSFLKTDKKQGTAAEVIKSEWEVTGGHASFSRSDSQQDCKGLSSSPKDQDERDLSSSSERPRSGLLKFPRAQLESPLTSNGQTCMSLWNKSESLSMEGQSSLFRPETALSPEGLLKSPFLQKSELDSVNYFQKTSTESANLSAENGHWDSPSEGSREHEKVEFEGVEDPPVPQPRQRSTKGHFLEDVPLKPKPRPRNLRADSLVEEQVQAGSPSSHAFTSSVSIPLSSSDGAETSKSFEGHGSYGELHHAHLAISEDSREETYSALFEECNEISEDKPDCGRAVMADVTRPSSSRATNSRKSRSLSANTAESKYLGTLKLLDQKLTLSDSKPEAADSLRATIYQEWVKKKQGKLQAEKQVKKQEENMKDQKRREEELTKKEDAKASYEAWKAKKSEVIKMKVRQKQELVRKQQMEIEENEEKKLMAQKAFEKWKREHDALLKEKVRKQSQSEDQLKQKKEQEKEERMKESISAFSTWNDKKDSVIQEKVKKERRKKKIKEEEEQYEKEERDHMALEMYEKWLRRKELQQKREKKERRIQTILQYDPPPPWSPPNKTIPSGK
ncbi:microtubule-associated protein 9 [Denticeps clupeoides]|uniref:Microtubule-associated protein 9 n=1 Tax=Denticeps clupeoides TaxID=299321 RepID=A0AAY4A7G1_9TELE|nr:microtubule-associated protein 9 [Denticeps clupeoides]